MERSETLNELAAALTLAQAEIEDAEKCKQNPAFRSKYADLGAIWDACKPALAKHGLSVAQFCEPAPEGQLMLTTMLLHKSGQFLSGTALIPLAKVDPQGYGSAMTYARRYGLAAMVGVCPEDDDGNAASGRGRDHYQNAPPQRNGPNPRAQQAVEAAETRTTVAPRTAAQRPAPSAPEELELRPPVACRECGSILPAAVIKWCESKGWEPLCRDHQPNQPSAGSSALRNGM